MWIKILDGPRRISRNGIDSTLHQTGELLEITDELAAPLLRDKWAVTAAAPKPPAETKIVKPAETKDSE